MDDREDFVTRERFPEADELIFGDFRELDKYILPYENAYYIILTRGHLGDGDCVRRLLRRPYEYLGMIGSKNKVRITRENLLKEGFSLEELDQVHAPIGIPLGGQLPEEIAVSIMAEVIQVKNQYYSAYCDEKVEAAVPGWPSRCDGHYCRKIRLFSKRSRQQDAGGAVRKDHRKHWRRKSRI